MVLVSALYRGFGLKYSDFPDRNTAPVNSLRYHILMGGISAVLLLTVVVVSRVDLFFKSDTECDAAVYDEHSTEFLPCSHLRDYIIPLGIAIESFHQRIRLDHVILTSTIRVLFSK